MYRGLPVLLLVTALVAAPAARAADPAPRIYVGALPGGGKIKFRIWPHRVRAKLHVLTSCSDGRDRFHDEKGLKREVERRRFSLGYALFGDTGDGAGSSEILTIKGRIRRGRVVGSIDYEASSYSIHTDNDARCESGKVRYTAWQRR